MWFFYKKTRRGGVLILLFCGFLGGLGAQDARGEARGLATQTLPHPIQIQATPPHNRDMLDALFAQLQQKDTPNPRRIERAIWREWSKSGDRLADIMLQNGQKAMRQKVYDAAITQFSVLIDTYPDFTEAWNMRATVYYLMGDYGRSIDDVQQVLIREPRHFGALAGLGAMLLQLDKKREALDAYKAAIAVNPHQIGAKQAIERLEQELQGESL